MTQTPPDPEPVEPPENLPVRYIVDTGDREASFWGSVELPDETPEKENR